MDVPTDCLWCGAALELPLETFNRCPTCGRGNHRDDLRIYRTRRPWARRLQASMQAAGITLLAIGFFYCAAYGESLRGSLDPKVALIIVCSLLGGFLLTYASGFVTRRRSARMPLLLVASLVGGPVLVAITFQFGASRLSAEVKFGLLALIAVAAVTLGATAWRRARA